MKLIFDKRNTETIHLNDITNNHIIVAIINNDACILDKTAYDDIGHYRFSILYNSSEDDILTDGNCYDICGTINNLKTFLTRANQSWPNAKIEVFDKKNWKDALTWLKENA